MVSDASEYVDDSPAVVVRIAADFGFITELIRFFFSLPMDEVRKLGVMLHA
jgi:hypothetical protein